MTRTVSAALVLVVFFAGCKAPPPPIVETEGVVLLDGEPLYNVEVRFFPMIEYGAEYVAKGITDKKGRFKLTCKGEDGACACENRVIIVEAALPAHLKSENAQVKLAAYLNSLGGRPLPERYSNLANSELVANVTPNQREYRFALTR